LAGGSRGVFPGKAEIAGQGRKLRFIVIGISGVERLSPTKLDRGNFAQTINY
jgi:hypothetical protein